MPVVLGTLFQELTNDRLRALYIKQPFLKISLWGEKNGALENSQDSSKWLKDFRTARGLRSHPGPAQLVGVGVTLPTGPGIESSPEP